MSKRLFEIAAEITKSQASISTMSAEEIEEALTKTFNALQKMQYAEEEGKELLQQPVEEAQTVSETTVDPRGSIHENKVVCLECGAEMRQLTANHLKTHHMTPREYKKKWGFTLKQPLSAKSLTRSRSRSAKKRGVPEELKRYQEEQRQRKQQTTSSLAS